SRSARQTPRRDGFGRFAVRLDSTRGNRGWLRGGGNAFRYFGWNIAVASAGGRLAVASKPLPRSRSADRDRALLMAICAENPQYRPTCKLGGGERGTPPASRRAGATQCSKTVVRGARVERRSA